MTSRNHICSVCFVAVIVIGVVRSKTMEPFVVGGEYVKNMEDYSYTAYLSILCNQGDRMYMRFECGASIVNQAILLTAGHCYECMPRGTSTIISVGSKNKLKYPIYRSSTYWVHENYDPKRIINDIGLVLLDTNLNLGNKVKRVMLANNLFPYVKEKADVAGWGDDGNPYQDERGIYLKVTKQRVWLPRKCASYIDNLPEDRVICGVSGYNRNSNMYGYSGVGDSGSALTVRGYVQLGLVSYNRPAQAADITIYTSVPHYHDWIKYNVRKLYCRAKMG